MRTRMICIALLTALGIVVSLAGLGTSAGEKKPDGKEEKKDTMRPKATQALKELQQLKAAFDLVEYGRKNKAPEVLIAAARVIGTSSLQPGKPDKEIKVEKVVEFDPRKEAEKLLEEALEISNGAPIQAMVKSTREAIADRPRGPLTGPRSFSGFLGPKGNQTIPLALRGGEQTTGFVQSLDGVDMDLFVTGALTGANYGQDTSANPNATVTFFLNVPGLINFRVHNFSNGNGRFLLVVN